MLEDFGDVEQALTGHTNGSISDGDLTNRLKDFRVLITDVQNTSNVASFDAFKVSGAPWS